MIKEKLIEKFGNIINQHSCVYLDDGENVLRELVKKCNPDTVIEIGTYQGVSAAVISGSAKKVYTIDIKDFPLRLKIWRHLQLKNISYYLVKNNKEKEEKIKKIFKTEKVDLCFIDGEHSKGQPPIDFEMVKECKNILFHDYNPAFSEVYALCNKIKGYKKTIKGSFCLFQKSKETSAMEAFSNLEKPKKKKRKRKKKNTE